MSLHAGRNAQHHLLFICCGQGQRTQQQQPDTSLLKPALQKQWDHAANAYLGNLDVKPYSNKIVAWRCDQCPDGHLHQWSASVRDRTRGTGCPQCTGRKVCQHSSLATLAPWAAAQWDYESNAACDSPATVAAQSNLKFGWRCQICGHTWTASPSNRIGKQSGCPECAPRGTITNHPTFAECQHPLLAEWDYKRNGACGNYSHNITLGSGKQIYWLCNQCPAGKEHSWSARPKSRTGRHPTGCAVCAGIATCRCNSLQALFPSIAAEWDNEKNTGKPADYTAYSDRVVWWCNPQRGSWQQNVHGRTSAHKRNIIVQRDRLQGSRQSSHD